jgi:hypothetical protein
MKLTRDAQILLAKYLAQHESPWRPMRDAYVTHGIKVGGAILAARQRGLRGAGGNGRSRMAEQRRRDELSKAGYIRAAALTAEGKQIARGWTWPYTAAELFEAIDRLRERASVGDCCRGWVPETLIVGCAIDRWPDPFADLQALLVPALADGVIESASTTDGFTLYRLAAKWPDARNQIAVSNESDLRDELCDAYVKEYRAAWEAVLNDEGRYQDIGPIPFPASFELTSGRHPNDVVGIELLFADV